MKKEEEEKKKEEKGREEEKEQEEEGDDTQQEDDSSNTKSDTPSPILFQTTGHKYVLRKREAKKFLKTVDTPSS